MKTAVIAVGLFVVGCSVPVDGGTVPPADSADPNAFLQPGGNSYSAPASASVVVVDPVTKFGLPGKRSSTNECIVDQASAPSGRAELTFESDGSIIQWPYDAQHPTGTWKQNGASDEVCLFGSCQTCAVQNDPNSNACNVACSDTVVLVEVYEYTDLIPFTFNCTNGVCTTLGGASVNADGTVTYNGFVLATWKGTHAEAEVCFGNRCSLFHPTL